MLIQLWLAVLFSCIHLLLYIQLICNPSVMTSILIFFSKLNMLKTTTQKQQDMYCLLILFLQTPNTSLPDSLRVDMYKRDYPKNSLSSIPGKTLTHVRDWYLPVICTMHGLCYAIISSPCFVPMMSFFFNIPHTWFDGV